MNNKLDIEVVDAYLLGCLQKQSDECYEKTEKTVKLGFNSGVIDAKGLGDLVDEFSPAMDVAITGLRLQDLEFGLTKYSKLKSSLGTVKVNYLLGYAKGFVRTAQIITKHDQDTLIGYMHRAMISLNLQDK